MRFCFIMLYLAIATQQICRITISTSNNALNGTISCQKIHDNCLGKWLITRWPFKTFGLAYLLPEFDAYSYILHKQEICLLHIYNLVEVLVTSIISFFASMTSHCLMSTNHIQNFCVVLISFYTKFKLITFLAYDTQGQ